MKKRKRLLLLELFVFALLIVSFIISICLYVKDTIDDDSSSIETSTYIHSKETIEENAHSLIELYRSDFSIYVQNKDTDAEIAEEARTRANSTAEYYNKYIQNSYLEENDEIPDGILNALPIIK